MRSIATLWPARGDLATAQLAMKIGALAGAAGACLAIALALAASRGSTLELSAVILALAFALATLAAAAGIYRRLHGAAYVAIANWVILGVLPSGIPLWLGLLVLAFLIVAARGAFVASAQLHTS